MFKATQPAVAQGRHDPSVHWQKQDRDHGNSTMRERQQLPAPHACINVKRKKLDTRETMSVKYVKFTYVKYHVRKVQKEAKPVCALGGHGRSYLGKEGATVRPARFSVYSPCTRKDHGIQIHQRDGVTSRSSMALA